MNPTLARPLAGKPSQASAESGASRRTRVAPIDGLRAIAVLGVVWFHVWQAFGNTPWIVTRVHGRALNLNEALSIGQTGVNLFFVISGFCMYLMYAGRQTTLDWATYGRFLKLRWLRIAPAFYVASLAVALYVGVSDHHFPGFALLLDWTSVQHLVPGGYDLAAPFWSLATEWHFYLLLPLFIWLAVRFGFGRTVGAAVLLCVLFRLASYTLLPVHSGTAIDWNWQSLVFFHLAAFCWGMCVAQRYVHSIAPPAVVMGYKGLAVGVLLAVVGRVLLWHATGASSAGGVVAQTLSLPLLTLGYSVVLWNVITSRTVLQRVLVTRPMQAIGRWSYSMYLWHAYPVAWICEAVVSRTGAHAPGQLLAFVLVLAVVTPLSWASYQLLERPYFSMRAHRQGSISVAAPAVS